jgi:transcriptional regulator with XRE-family HTH domain
MSDAESGTLDPQLAVLADEIRHFRKKNQFSLEKFAEVSGISRSTISKIERCATVPPSSMDSAMS